MSKHLDLQLESSWKVGGARETTEGFKVQQPGGFYREGCRTGSEVGVRGRGVASRWGGGSYACTVIGVEI